MINKTFDKFHLMEPLAGKNGQNLDPYAANSCSVLVGDIIDFKTILNFLAINSNKMQNFVNGKNMNTSKANTIHLIATENSIQFIETEIGKSVVKSKLLLQGSATLKYKYCYATPKFEASFSQDTLKKLQKRKSTFKIRSACKIAIGESKEAYSHMSLCFISMYFHIDINLESYTEIIPSPSNVMLLSIKLSKDVINDIHSLFINRNLYTNIRFYIGKKQTLKLQMKSPGFKNTYKFKSECKYVTLYTSQLNETTYRASVILCLLNQFKKYELTNAFLHIDKTSIFQLCTKSEKGEVMFTAKPVDELVLQNKL